MPAAADVTGVRVRDRAAYLSDAGALVVADLHLGRAATTTIAFPFDEYRETAGRLRAVVETFDPTEVVVAGDVLHAFSRVPDGVTEALAELRDTVEDAHAVLTVVEGNHDAMLPGLVDTVAEHRLEDGTVVCHGHEEPSLDADRYVVGHDHPAIAIEGERRPCFLLGRGVYRGADVLALPAFDRLAAGVEVNGLRPGDAASPLLRDVDAFHPIVYDDGTEETFVFPPLGSLQGFL